MKYLVLIALFIVAAIIINKKKVKEVVQQIADGSKEKIDQANASAQKAVDKIADKTNTILPIDLSGNTPVSVVNDNINKSGANSGLRAQLERDTTYWNQPLQQEPPTEYGRPVANPIPDYRRADVVPQVVSPVQIRPVEIFNPIPEGPARFYEDDNLYGDERGRGTAKRYQLAEL